MKFTRVVVYISIDQYRRLKEKLATQGKTVSGWFRKVVNDFLEEE